MLLLICVSCLSLGVGAAGLSFERLAAAALGSHPLDRRDEVILYDIRLPRLVLGLLVGASLAVAGAIMQGLSAIPGRSRRDRRQCRGGLGAVAARSSLADCLPGSVAGLFGIWLVPWAAFCGGWAMTLLLSAVATRSGEMSIATLLLAGSRWGRWRVRAWVC